MGFEWAYRNGTPPWDIGRAQPVIVRLAEEGLVTGDVIDVGCGTGENALYLASRGLAVIGVDAAPTAVRAAVAACDMVLGDVIGVHNRAILALKFEKKTADRQL